MLSEIRCKDTAKNGLLKGHKKKGRPETSLLLFIGEDFS